MGSLWPEQSAVSAALHWCGLFVFGRMYVGAQIFNIYFAVVEYSVRRGRKIEMSCGQRIAPNVIPLNHLKHTHTGPTNGPGPGK